MSQNQEDGSANKKSGTTTAIKLAAKEASERVSGGRPDPGPGDLSAAPSSMPEPIDIPEPPTASELVVKSAGGPATSTAMTQSGPSSAQRGAHSTGPAISTVKSVGSKRLSGNMAPESEAAKSGPAASEAPGDSEADLAPSEGEPEADEPAASEATGTSEMPAASAASEAGSSMAPSEVGQPRTILPSSAKKMKSQTKGSVSGVKVFPTASSATSKSAGGSKQNTLSDMEATADDPGPSGSKQSKGKSVAGAKDLGATSESKPKSAGPSSAGPKSAGSSSAGPASASPKSAGSAASSGPKSASSQRSAGGKTRSVSSPAPSASGGSRISATGSRPMTPGSSRSRTSKPSDDNNSDLMKSMSPGGGKLVTTTHVGKDGKKVTKFRYHKRITVHTKGNTKPEVVMKKVNKKDHKAGLTMSALDNLNSAEVMKRAGLKPHEKANWRLRLRQTKKVTKNGKTHIETKLAYRDSKGNKNVKTTTDPYCMKCGKKAEECKCTHGSSK